jgi:hypothetical protein
VSQARFPISSQKGTLSRLSGQQTRKQSSIVLIYNLNYQIYINLDISFGKFKFIIKFKFVITFEQIEGAGATDI